MGQTKSKLSHDQIIDLQRNTLFDRREILQWYRGFLRDFPSGYMDKADLHRLYTSYFPFSNVSNQFHNSSSNNPGGGVAGNSKFKRNSSFINHLFRILDRSKDSKVSFAEFLITISVIMRGSQKEKIELAFMLYDVDGDGMISFVDLLDVVSSLYDLVGDLRKRNPNAIESPSVQRTKDENGPRSQAQLPIVDREEDTPIGRVRKVFISVFGNSEQLADPEEEAPDVKMDLQQFSSLIEEDPVLLQAISFFDGVLIQ